MSDFGRLMKESLSFSKSEGLPRFQELKSKIIEEKNSYYKEVVYMGKESRILLIASLAVIVIGIFLFLLWDKLPFVSSPKQVAKVQPSKEVVVQVKQPQNINAKVTMAYGDVKVVNMGEISDVEVGYVLRYGDVIQTGPDSECEVQISGSGVLRITENSSVSLSEIVFASSKRTETEAFVVSGSVKSAFKKLPERETFKVKTETAIAAVRGTKFSVSVDNQGKTKLVVTEGKVIFAPRISKLEEIKEATKDDKVKGKISEIELSGGIVVDEGKKAEITPKAKLEAESSVSNVIVKMESAITQGKVEDEIVSKVEKVVASLSKKDLVKKSKAETREVNEVEKYVSKSLVGDATVKVSIVPADKEVKGSEVYIDEIFMGKIPLSKMLVQGRKYKLEVKKGRETIYSYEFEASKDMKIEVKFKKESKELPSMTLAQEKEEIKFTSRDINFVPTISYGKIGIYSEDYIAVPYYSGVAFVYGDKVKTIPTKEFISIGFGDNLIAVISKSEDGNRFVRVFSVDGNLVGEFDISERSKGLLSVGKVAVISKKVIVPVLDGVGIIDIASGNMKVANVGNTFSDIGSLNDSAVVVNEIGEVYKVSLDGSASKIGQLGSTSVRRCIVMTHSDGSIYVLYKGKLYSFGSKTYVRDLDISEAFGAIYGDKIVLNATTKVVVIDRNSGKVINSVDIVGKVNGVPYLKGNYLVITATDGLHVYNLVTGKEEKSYDIVSYASLIKDGNIYVIGKSKMFIVPMK